VIVYAPNSADVLLAGAALRAVSAVPVPMNHRLTADEAAYILDDSDAVLVFAGDAFLPVVEAVRARAPRVRHWVLLVAPERTPPTMPPSRAGKVHVGAYLDPGFKASLLLLRARTGWDTQTAITMDSSASGSSRATM
jgi:acyl-CoA synthetase (AMP-forming)/AMP-acid ligase II